MGCRMRVLATLAVCLLFATAPVGLETAAQITAYPEKLVRLMVPFPAGGATDIVARLIAERLSGLWSQPIVIENIGGAAGAIATAQAAKAAPDGYSLLVATGTTMTLLPHLRRSLSFDPLRDFEAISLICTFPNILVVRPDLPVNDLTDLLALVRASPGKYSYASSGYGGSPHIAAEWFKLISKTDILHIPFTGSAPALPALLGGHVDMMFDTLPTVWPLVQQGKLHALGVTMSTRMSFLPHLPAIAETFPGYDVTSWLGIVVPAATPRAITAKLSVSILHVMRDPEVLRRLNDIGTVGTSSTPDEFSAFIRQDFEKWRRVIAQTGITLNN